MARITHRLTAITVANVKGKGLYPDGGGLYLRVTNTGTKSWVFRFMRDGHTHDMGLGPLPEVSLARARELAGEARQCRSQGANPILARQAERTAARLAETNGVSFKHCAEKLIAAREDGWRNRKSALQWRNTLETYAYPVFRENPVSDIDTTLVVKVLQPIWAGKPVTAARVRSRIEAVLDWAKVSGFRSGENAARWRGHLDHLLQSPTKIKRIRHHPALPFVEIAKFVAELRTQERLTARALEFTVLTAVRSSEGLGAQWREIDFAKRLWIIPPERMKGNREHRVPLSARAIAILEGMLPARRCDDFVFPGRKPGRPLSYMSLLMLMREMRPGFTVHGFRSTFRDWAAETTSFPNHVVEMALAHAVSDAVEAAYRRGDLLEKRRKLMDVWAAYCDRRSAEIVSLTRGGRAS
jgi:integrase